ncbi:MAG: nucleoside recognition domain-containing protein [Eubacterium sp.]
MLNYIWAFMIVCGVIYGLATGNIEQVGNGAIDSATEAVKLCITMVGIMSMWMGFMEIAKNSGLIAKAEKGLEPIIIWLFPNLPKDHPARPHIITNIIANILGLGWAATPAGLKAMEELAGTPVPQKGKVVPPHIATDEMCTFLVVNISSLQLIPVNIIAYRSQYGAANPAGIVAPAIIATTISTLIGIIFCKIMCKK